MGQALLALPHEVLAMAGALAVLSHVTYGSFDWVGRHCTGHRLGRGTTLGIAMTSYPFTLNLGSLIGGVGVRYRLYARRGVTPGNIGQVVGTSIVTNWLGYLLLAALLPWFWQPPALAGWELAPWHWRAGGALLGCLPLATWPFAPSARDVRSRCGVTAFPCRAGPSRYGRWWCRQATGC